MSDHPDRIPTEILDYSYLNNGPVKYIREDVVKTEIDRLTKERNAAMEMENRAWWHVHAVAGERDAALAEVERLTNLLMQCDHPECAGLSNPANRKEER